VERLSVETVAKDGNHQILALNLEWSFQKYLEIQPIPHKRLLVSIQEISLSVPSKEKLRYIFKIKV
jgi:hypothetical protein